MASDDRRALLQPEHLTEARDVVDERAERELRRSHSEAVCLQVLDDSAPRGSVGPGSVDENDVRQALHVFRRVSSGAPPTHITRSCESKSRNVCWLCWIRGGPMPTARTPGFQGRDPELAQIRGELERLADGEETGVIVEG